ncbi:hypothetical protein ACLB2K_058610 [Fragaria x ananassa]
MGLSSLPAPSEGFMCVILVNTALSVSIIKGLVRSILRIVGIRLSSSSSASPSSPPSEEYIEDPSETFELHLSSSGSYIEEIRSRIPAVRFDSVCNLKTEHDCSVCLSEFQPESEINHLSCGHVFHQDCLEKWLNYWNITCPLCRTPLMPVEETSCFWFFFTRMHQLAKVFVMPVWEEVYLELLVVLYWRNVALSDEASSC